MQQTFFKEIEAAAIEAGAKTVMMAERLAACFEMPPTPAVIIRHVGDIMASPYICDVRAVVDVSWLYDDPARAGASSKASTPSGRATDIEAEAFAARMEAASKIVGLCVSVSPFLWGAPPTEVRHWRAGKRAAATVRVTLSERMEFNYLDNDA